MKIVAHKRSAKTGSSRFPQVTKDSPTVNQGPRSHHGIHEFRWIQTKSGGTAICTCGRWQLYQWGGGTLTRESAKRNHALHLCMVTDRAVGHEGALQDEAPRQTKQIPLEGQFSTKKGGFAKCGSLAGYRDGSRQTRRLSPPSAHLGKVRPRWEPVESQ